MLTPQSVHIASKNDFKTQIGKGLGRQLCIFHWFPDSGCSIEMLPRAEVLTGYRQSLEQSSSTNEVRDFFDGHLFRDFHPRELGLFKDPHDVALHLSRMGSN